MEGFVLLKENYVLSFVIEEISKGTDKKVIKDWLKLDKKTLDILAEYAETGEVLGSKLTKQDILTAYKSGLTYPEIGEIKGVTRVAIRLMIHGMTKKKLEAIKEENMAKRNDMKAFILHRRVWIAVQLLGFDEACKQSGYSEAFFKKRYRELDKQVRKQYTS